MLDSLKKKIKVEVGNINFVGGPYEIFDKNVILFLNEISKEIFNTHQCKKFPDLISFGFWCRKANVQSIFEKYKHFKNRLGRGTTLHITPSNVPTNFAYSMAFGLLSGNNNIIRLSSRNYHQLNILKKILNKLSKKKKLKESFKRFALIKYETSDFISSELSKNVEARVIWGGDSTIKKFKSYNTKPRCIDLTFANRYSISIINSDYLSKVNINIKNLARKFYNDTYTMDQFGCSSPTSIFWLGQNKIVRENFWSELREIVNNNYDFDISGANKKISNLMNYSIELENINRINIENFNLIRLKNEIKKFKNFHEINFGTFYEYNLKNLDNLRYFVTEKLQTITYVGIKLEVIKKFIIKNNIKGIDRIVPVGRAFDITPEWDGVDIISTLSRTIAT